MSPASEVRSRRAIRPAPAQPGRRLSQLARIGVGELREVGPRRAAALGSMGIESVLDLLLHYPNRWEDRSAQRPISELVEGEPCSVVAAVRRVTARRSAARRSLVEVVLDDGTGLLACSFFNQPWRTRQLPEGTRLAAFGKVTRYRGSWQLANPSVQVLEDGEEAPAGRVVAIYPESEKAAVTSALLERCIAEALERAGAFADPLPRAWRGRLHLAERTEALRRIHRPEHAGDQYPARRRLAFDELLRLQVALVMRKRAAAAASRGIAHVVKPVETSRRLVERFLAGLPFALTAAQQKVIGEIAADLASPLPMHRLLQGDVGAGKTVVALASLLFAAQGGHQGALMVPTEVLAEQHFLGAVGLLAGLEVPSLDRLGGERPVRVELLTSRSTAGERARIVAGLASGEVDVLVGTHALITEDVGFASLGVVVIDEQHRFGVDQRAALREKGSCGGGRPHDPDLLVMTATPIPRTAAMTVYGDLDYSVLDELPAGRARVETRWLRDRDAEAEAWARVRSEVAAGHHAFVVCPLVGAGTGDDDGAGAGADEEGGGRSAHSAVEEAGRLAAGELAGCRVGLLHGQLPPRERDRAMMALRRGELDVLVATTVIEVGVDVPEATVVVVEDADRFGIAQLHQLRGRVGRSRLASWCFLVAPGEGVSAEAATRLQALEATSDGFELAEVDLELRGEGTVLGTRQKGRNDLKLASLRRDRDLVEEARRVAEAIVGEDPQLAAQPLLADELRLFIGEEEAEYLFRS